MSSITISQNVSKPQQTTELPQNNFISNDLRNLSIKPSSDPVAVEEPVLYSSSIERGISVPVEEPTNDPDTQNFVYDIPDEDRELNISKHSSLKNTQETENIYGINRKATWINSKRIKGATFDDSLILDGGFF